MIEKLKPAVMDYLWGGTTLRDVYGKDNGLPRQAESWELSAHPAGESVLSGGQYDGMSFSAYLEACGGAPLGSRGGAFPFFPVLIKFIDAKQPLSVQVHPSDAYALAHEGGYGKTEMWYVMDCEPGAFLYCGVNQTLTRSAFEAHIRSGTVETVLNRVPVHPGDVFFIESGTLHAIGAGVLICEIQQNANCTYRVYDYGRRDDQGNLRPLHIAQALDVANLTAGVQYDTASAVVPVPGGTRQLLASCRYFETNRYEVTDAVTITVTDASFASLVFLSGTATVTGTENSQSCKMGDSIFIPAGSGVVSVTGKCSLIQTTV